MRYRFGECELDAATRDFNVAGERQSLEPQVFDLLLHLAEARDRVVGIDELIQSVWRGRIVSDSAIAARISAVRTALGDDGARQAWIRTVRGRGFRFVGPVVEIGQGPAVPTTPPDQLERQRIAFCRSADGTRIAYGVSGAGRPLVRAGHWLTHLEHDAKSPIWRPFLDRLGRSFRVIRYDQRGNGLSDWDAPDLSFERFVEDVEAVADAATDGSFVLYGASQGVPIAIAYAVRHPERVSHLILQGGYEQGRQLRGSASEREQAEAILTLMRHGWGQRGSAFINAFAAMFIPAGDREQVDSLVELQRLTTSPENAVRIRSTFDRFDVSGRLGDVAVPTLVLHCRDDAIQPLEQGRRLAAGIPGAEFVLLESPNHIVLAQEPACAVLFGAIERFVEG